MSEPTTATVTSRDGSTIGFTSIGKGPSVIVIPGALSTAATYDDFARQLAERFSVHVVERRGRGVSSPQGHDYGIRHECEDVLALQALTGASYFVGHSFGGLIALEAARRNRGVVKLAVYEPGVSIGQSISVSWIPEFERKLAAGKPLDALAVFSLAAGPKHARRTPEWLMRLLLPHVMGRAVLAEILELLPTTIAEHREVARLDGSVANYGEVTAPVLLMSGGRSHLAWVETALQALTKVLPRCHRLEFPALDHFGIDKRAPREVARAVTDYFSD